MYSVTLHTLGLLLQGSISEFLVTVNRDVEKFVKSERCNLKKDLVADTRDRAAVIANAPREYLKAADYIYVSFL